MTEKCGRTDGRFFRGQGTLGGLSDPEKQFLECTMLQCCNVVGP